MFQRGHGVVSSCADEGRRLTINLRGLGGLIGNSLLACVGRSGFLRLLTLAYLCPYLGSNVVKVTLDQMRTENVQIRLRARAVSSGHSPFADVL